MKKYRKNSDCNQNQNLLFLAKREKDQNTQILKDRGRKMRKFLVIDADAKDSGNAEIR